MLAVATDPSGEHAWAVGGYDGTEDAAGQGTEESLSSRPAGWQTASIWRYDTAGSAQPSELTRRNARTSRRSRGRFPSPSSRARCARKSVRRHWMRNPP